jgi:hypothetical protein
VEFFDQQLQDEFNASRNEKLQRGPAKGFMSTRLAFQQMD